MPNITTHVTSLEYDPEGNVICPDCQAHVRPGAFQLHDCPPWLRALVKSRKDMSNRNHLISVEELGK